MLEDLDPAETREWVEALDSVLAFEGADRAFYLLDEVTAELDVLSRADLLRFLREESQQRAVTIIYASHVLEGLAAWATHLAFLSPGRLRRFAPLGEVAELLPGGAAALAAAAPGTPSPLHQLCEQWMREDRPAIARARAPAVTS